MSNLYLMIQNTGEFDHRAITLLGVSSSRNNQNENIVGCFGSGCKNAINTLLRKGLNPIIFIGNRKITFFTKPIVIKTLDGDSNHGQVCACIDGEIQELGFVIEFGAIDWISEEMAIRELISNSIDASYKLEESPIVISVKTENDIIGETNTTRVFIPLTTEIQKAYQDINKIFLHFAHPELLSQQVLRKLNKNRLDNNKGPCIYRRGVLVGELKGDESLFDYNCKDIKLDESRNVANSEARSVLASTIASSNIKVICRILESFLEVGKSYYEQSLPIDYYIIWNEDNKKRFLEAWNAQFGEKAIIAKSGMPIEFYNKIVAKGHIIIIIDKNPWYEALKDAGVKQAIEILTTTEKRNTTFFECNTQVKQQAIAIWQVFVEHQMVFGKNFPEIKLFDETTEGGERRLGYVHKEVVYLNKDLGEDSVDLRSTIVEELIHYITDSQDFTRDFQNFTTKLISKLI